MSIAALLKRFVKPLLELERDVRGVEAQERHLPGEVDPDDVDRTFGPLWKKLDRRWVRLTGATEQEINSGDVRKVINSIRDLAAAIGMDVKKLGPLLEPLKVKGSIWTGDGRFVQWDGGRKYFIRHGLRLANDGSLINAVKQNRNEED